MHKTLADYCRRTEQEHLLKEWDYEKNSPLTPENVSYGSKKHVWWHCKQGHSWQAAVHSRSCSGSGCPYCSGRYIIPGKTDLATTYPEVAAEWHPTKNGDLTPQEVSAGSHRSVWWQCQKGHEWKAQIKSRTHGGAGCPVCCNKAVQQGENDLASSFPDIAAEWHPTKNGDLTPEDVVGGCRRKVWWICEKGHEYYTTVHSRTHGSGCPVCTGKQVLTGENDLATKFPEIARQWHPTKNGKLTPDQVAPASNKKVWWICEQGHEYQAIIGSRTQRFSGCPYCTNKKVLPGFNDLATKYPDLAAEWHPTLNETLTPDQVLRGSRRKVWWICKEGHVWKAAIYSRTGPQKTGCPVCSNHTRNSTLIGPIS